MTWQFDHNLVMLDSYDLCEDVTPIIFKGKVAVFHETEPLYDVG